MAILERHLPGCSVACCAGALDGALTQRAADASEQVAAERLVEAALTKLAKQLRGLPEVALKVGGGVVVGGAVGGEGPGGGGSPHNAAGRRAAA